METPQLLKESNLTVGENEHRLSIADNNLNIDYPKQKCIHEVFEEQARNTPENIAVVMDDECLTYRELDEKSNQLAHYLKGNGVGPDTLVGICLDRSLEMVIAILSILKAGGAYVPFDPYYPKDRIAYMLEDSGCRILISQLSFQAILLGTKAQIICYDKDLPQIAQEPRTNVDSGTQPHHLAYVIYTSGSTGKPKGVLIEHRNVVRLLFNDRFQFDFNAQDTWTIFHSFCFDFSVWEMYGALLYGGKAVIVPKEAAKDSHIFAKIVAKEKVTVINQTPSAFYNLIPKMLDSSDAEMAVRYIIFGGEKLNPVKLNRIKRKFPAIKFINMYGITETTVHVTYKEITLQDIEAGFSNIGKPIPTLTAYIFDKNMKLAPIGVEGELCVGGEGVSRGYLNRPDLTSEKFVRNPYNPEEIIYRSGDLACMRENGDLEYFGRMDTQVQLRGFRIELGEIESVIAGLEDIEDCVVVAHEDSNQDKRLIAYVIFKENEITADKIREHISRQLPEYMIPSFFIKIDRIPLTSNGKLDNKKLPKPDIDTVSTTEYVAPGNEDEQTLTAIWSEVLGIEQNKIGVEHNFFEIGGHSLGAAAIAQHIRHKFSKAITIRYIFENPTIAQLVKVLPRLEDLKAQTRPKAVVKKSNPKSYPIMNGQIISWMLKCLSKIDTSNVCGIFTIDGDFDPELFQRAFNTVAGLHDALWYPFYQKKPMMKIQQPMEAAVKFIDLSNQEMSDHQEVLNEELLEQELHSPFDLSRAPHFRIAVVRQRRDKHFLLAAFPHIVCDYASLNAFIQEVFEAYRSSDDKNDKVRQEKKTTALEMVDLEKEYMQSDEFSKGYYFWKEKLRNPKMLKLKQDLFLPAGKPRGEKLLTKITLSKQTVNRLQKVATDTNTSIQMVILTLIKATIHSLSGQDDFSISMIMDARGIYDDPPVVNVNVGSIAVRTDFSIHNTYLKLLDHIKWVVIDSHSHFKFPNTISIPVLSLLKAKPLTEKVVRMLSAVQAWRFRKAMVDRGVVASLASHFLGMRVIEKSVRKENNALKLAPAIVYNVMPNFYENKVLWSDGGLSVSDLRDREKIMPHHVFEENSEYQDSAVLNFELIKDVNEDVCLFLWGGKLKREAFELMRGYFLEHLEKIMENPTDQLLHHS